MPIQTIDFGTVDSATYNGSDVSSIVLNGSEIWSAAPPGDPYLATDLNYNPISHAPLSWDANSTWSPTAHVIIPLMAHNGKLYIGYLLGSGDGTYISNASSNITNHGRYITIGNYLTTESSFNISFSFRLHSRHAYGAYITDITSNIVFNGSVITENVEYYYPDNTFTGTGTTRNGATRQITLNRGAKTIQVSRFSNGYTNTSFAINYSDDTSHSSPVSSIYHYAMGVYAAGLVEGPYITLT